ncbi:protein phosphatase 1 regulatory subunit 3G [Lissotriton helveticus]
MMEGERGLPGAGVSPCKCSDLDTPPSPVNLDRRRTWCDGEALLGPRAGAHQWPLEGALRAWAALAPELREEDEEDEPPTSPPRARRALSLPDSTCCHKCKKRVQFADTLGLSLASVKHYSSAEEPQVPPGVLTRLQEDAGEPPPPLASAAFHLVPEFPQPPGGRALAERLQREGVCLERASGTGQFEARVWALVRGPGVAVVRYTFNEWLSFVDAEPEGPGDPQDGGGLRLSFTLSSPPCLQPGACLHFALCYREEEGEECWDNNQGLNYILRYLAVGGPAGDPD